MLFNFLICLLQIYDILENKLILGLIQFNVNIALRLKSGILKEHCFKSYPVLQYPPLKMHAHESVLFS
jgi:hypothetical protein